MQELLKTLITNPYNFIILIALGLAPIGLIIMMIDLSSNQKTYKKFSEHLFKTGIYLVGIALLLPVFLNNIALSKQQEAIDNIQATAKKEGDKLIIHSESKWLKDGSFDIVGENNSHYFIKENRRIIEVNKLETNH